MNKEKIQVISSFEVYRTEQDLANEDRLLLMHARKSLENAYAPYSHFNVGAAILLENGEIVVGNNQENAAYPSSLCAERVAIYYSGAKYPGVKIKALAVTVKAESQVISEPVTPCGACRQAIAEYETRYEQKIRMIMAGETGKIYISESIESLLPLMFNKKFLK
ncbi:MAG TPA: cytidine deaminase [Bacteroidia bacterium]